MFAGLPSLSILTSAIEGPGTLEGPVSPGYMAWESGGGQHLTVHIELLPKERDQLTCNKENKLQAIRVCLHVGAAAKIYCSKME